MYGLNFVIITGKVLFVKKHIIEKTKCFFYICELESSDPYSVTIPVQVSSLRERVQAGKTYCVYCTITPRGKYTRFTAQHIVELSEEASGEALVIMTGKMENIKTGNKYNCATLKLPKGEIPVAYNPCSCVTEGCFTIAQYKIRCNDDGRLSFYTPSPIVLKEGSALDCVDFLKGKLGGKSSKISAVISA